MIRNYLKIAMRNLLKSKFVSFVNLFGLTVGLCCCMLILVYITHELSYDKYQPDADRIYRVTRSFRNSETGAVSLHLGAVAPPVGPLLQNDFKEIEGMTRMLRMNNVVIAYDEKVFNEKQAFFADEHFFDFFNVDVINGNRVTALRDPYSVMITEDMARKYFGADNPINKMVKLGNEYSLKVTGVYKPFPENTHFHPGLMISFNTLKDSAIYGANKLLTNWGNNSFPTYIKLPERYDPARLEARFPALSRQTPRSKELSLDYNDAAETDRYPPALAP